MNQHVKREFYNNASLCLHILFILAIDHLSLKANIWDPQASWNSIFPCSTHSFMIKYLLDKLFFSVLSRHFPHWNVPLFQWHQFFGFTQTKLFLFFPTLHCGFCLFHPTKPCSMAVWKVMGFRVQQSWVQAPFLLLASPCSFKLNIISICFLV